MDRIQSRELIKSSFAPFASLYRNGALEHILSAYGEEQRTYHNEKHIGEMLQLLGQHIENAARPDLIAQAILWHDMVYRTQQEDGTYRPDSLNVAESITRFESFITDDMPVSDREAIKFMIGATDGHKVSMDQVDLYPGLKNDTGLFLDFDLYQFAKPWQDFMANTADIRQEFAWVPEQRFNQSRATILDKFRERDLLYFTVPEKDMWTEQAKANLQRSAEQLRQMDL